MSLSYSFSEGTVLRKMQSQEHPVGSTDAEPTPEAKWKRYLVNRWTRSFAVYLGLLLTASAYSNWQPLFLILNSMGAYQWICDEDSTHNDDFAHCDEQYNYLSQIFTVAGNMAYVIGLLAGTLMDSIGGRWTMMLGVVVLYAGWLMITYSSQDVPMYWPGLIFLGCAENLLGFPGFLVGDFWPLVRDTCASLCIAMQMLSSWMPVVLWIVVENSPIGDIGQSAIEYYMLACAVPCILMVLATPGRSSAITKKVNAEIAEKNSDSPLKDMDMKEKLMNAAYWKGFAKLMATADFGLFCVWYILLTLGFGFYNTKIMSHSGQEVGEFIGMLSPFRAAVGPMMGIASDCIGAFHMLILDNVLLAVSFGVSLIPVSSAYYTSAVFYVIGRSFCFTTKYIFVQNFFPKEHFGKLSGVISLLGGLFGFLNAWFQVLEYDTKHSFAFCAVLTSVIVVIPIYLMLKHARIAKKEKMKMKESCSFADVESQPLASD